MLMFLHICWMGKQAKVCERVSHNNPKAEAGDTGEANRKCASFGSPTPLQTATPKPRPPEERSASSSLTVSHG